MIEKLVRVDLQRFTRYDLCFRQHLIKGPHQVFEMLVHYIDFDLVFFPTFEIMF